MGDITQLLSSSHAGNQNASAELISIVYDELRRIASAKLSREASGHTLQPTALVHEAWLRLGADHQPNWQNRAHFFSAAAEAMRRILVDRARRRIASKRGGGAEHIDLDNVELPGPPPENDDVLRVHEALDKFASVYPRKAELVKLRYFLGLTFDEAAPLLGIAVPTAKEWWAHSRAWLAVEIAGNA